MNYLHRKHYWFGRFLASDPGRKRLQQAGKTTCSLIFAVFTVLFLLRISGNDLFTPVLVAGVVGVLANMTVMDDTREKKMVTTGFVGAAAIAGITIGSLLADNAYYIGILMVAVIFCAFYFSKYGSRYFSMGMTGFMTIYFSSFLSLSPSMFPWFYLAIAIGTIYAFIFNFIVFKDSAQLLKHSIRSFHIQANLTFDILIRVIEDPKTVEKRLNNLQKNIDILRAYARHVSTDLNVQDVKEVWPGLEPAQLRLYVFDAAMLVETLADSVERLKRAEGLETVEIRRLIVRVVEALRDADVLALDYREENLNRAERAIEDIHSKLDELMNHHTDPPGWLFLIRRIESIANHVVKGGTTIQQALLTKEKIEKTQEESVEAASSEEDGKENKGLEPSTRKAIQSLVTATIAIIVGYLISPVQPYWVLLTAFIVQLGTESVGRIYIKGFQRSLGTIFGAVIGFLLANMVSGNSVLEVTMLFCVVFFAFYVFSVSYTWMSVFITMLIAFLYDLLLGGISLELMGARVIDTIAGAGIAWGVAAVIFPKKTRDKVADTFGEYLDELEPFLTGYVRRFREDVEVKWLTDHAFMLDQKLQAMREEAQSLIHRPGMAANADVSRWITIFTAINYYARQLVASSYQKQFDYPQELETDFIEMETKLESNIGLLKKLITDEEQGGAVYSLDTERERMERQVPNKRGEGQSDLVHHLYYIWKINKSLAILSQELGAVIKNEKTIK